MSTGNVISAGAAQTNSSSLAHARFTLSSDSSVTSVCPFSEGQGDTDIITNAAGTITIPPGKYRIIAHATRHGAVLDYDLYNVTTGVVLEKYTTKDTSFASNSSTLPYYLEVDVPTQIRIQEGDQSANVVWNGREAGNDAGYTGAMPNYGCFIDIQQLPSLKVVEADQVVVEDVEVLLDSGSFSAGSLTLPADLSDYSQLRFEATDINNHSFSSYVGVAGIADNSLYLFSDGSSTVGFNMDATGTIATLFSSNVFAGQSGNFAVYGVKPQKTVVSDDQLIPEALHRASMYSANTGSFAAPGVYPEGSATKFDPDGLILSASHEYTIKQAGTYRVTAISGETSTPFNTYVRLNGAIAYLLNNGSDDDTKAVSGFMDLVAGDVIDLWRNDGGTIGILNVSTSVEQVASHTVIAAETAAYSTTERQTDRTWIDGKPIYERVWQFNPGTTADEVTIITAAETALMDTIIEKIEHARGNTAGYLNSSNEGGSITNTVNAAANGGQWSWRTYGTSTGDIRFTKNGYSNADALAHVILRYTKV